MFTIKLVPRLAAVDYEAGVCLQRARHRLLRTTDGAEGGGHRSQCKGAADAGSPRAQDLQSESCSHSNPIMY